MVMIASTMKLLSVSPSPVQFETPDGHENPQVFSIIHTCEPITAENLPVDYELLLKNIRDKWDPVASVNLGTELFVEAWPHKYLHFTPLVVAAVILDGELKRN